LQPPKSFLAHGTQKKPWARWVATWV
jgi:hypothetical protein